MPLKGVVCSMPKAMEKLAAMEMSATKVWTSSYHLL